MLDEIGIVYPIASHCGAVFSNAPADAAQMLSDVTERPREGLRKTQRFADTVHAFSCSVVGNPEQGLAALSAEMDFLSASVASLVAYETLLCENLEADVERLANDAAAVRKATATNCVTGLPDRVALSTRLTEL